MAIVVTCTCGKRLAAKDEAAGKRVRCPACQQPVMIPLPAEVPVVAAIVEAPPPVAPQHSEPVVATPVPEPAELAPRTFDSGKDGREPESKPTGATDSAPESAANETPPPAPHAKTNRKAKLAALTRTLGSATRPAIKVAGRLPWFHVLSLVSVALLVLGLIAIFKPTLIIAPRTVTSPPVDSAQTVVTRKLATFGTSWVLQEQSTKRVVAGGGMPAGAVAEPLTFAEPGTFVTDPNARRRAFPGFAYAYEGRSDGGLLVLESRTEIRLSMLWLIALVVLPAAWVARFVLRRRRNATVAA